MQQQTLDQTDQLLAMLGPEGIFAILGTIILVRTFRTFRYWEQWELFILNAVTAGLVGAGSTYFVVEQATEKQISGGAFMCIIGSMIAYEAMKWACGVVYEKTGFETVRAFYFFLSPGSLKYKDRGLEKEIPPHATLTQIFDKTRLDK